MRILIIGGAGHVGARLVARLRQSGHDVRVGSRDHGVDALTGAGLGDAMTGIDVVVDVLNTTEMEPAAATAFFKVSTERIIAAEQTAGVRHHVLLSIVGADRARGNGYYVGKVAQEDAVRAAEVSYSIVRATQFYDFVPTIADWLTVDGSVQAPRMLLQPVDVDDVVDLLAEVATGAPLYDAVSLAGPSQYHLDVLLRAVLADRADGREVLTIDGIALGADADDSLVPLGAHRTGRRPFPIDVPSAG
ncbi:SDR family oxidoreductase [Herbiconiux sp. L3-i23]|uniref:SDR family oxidoreductase n=1 Tax=Herbiconiux sp. L3-i23 TaxID=2905871 RepID=UPI002066478D|nr:NAD(P)H-binding protein [Herbiconiux sp. L3-i23]BDI21417.1 hypothetical protein L3i23_01930 [Herbiconiux sp. L3-i23]